MYLLCSILWSLNDYYHLSEKITQGNFQTKREKNKTMGIICFFLFSTKWKERVKLLLFLLFYVKTDCDSTIISFFFLLFLPCFSPLNVNRKNNKNPFSTFFDFFVFNRQLTKRKGGRCDKKKRKRRKILWKTTGPVFFDHTVSVFCWRLTSCCKRNDIHTYK